MNKLLGFFSLIRWLNLLILLLTQVLAAWCLSEYEHVSHFLSIHFVVFITSTVLIAAAGYILNDYVDVKLDLINKPDKVVVGKIISRRWAMIWHMVFNVAALLGGLWLSWRIALLFAATIVLLWLYSSRLKKRFFSGNLLVALLTAMSLLMLPLFDENIQWSPILVFSLFAFLSTLVREIIKDVEDMKGDARYAARTLPIAWGMRAAKRVVAVVMSALIILLLVYLFFMTRQLGYGFLWYGIVAIWIPMNLFLFKLRKADKKKDFTALSRMCKLIMLTGLFSMMFFKL